MATLIDVVNAYTRNPDGSRRAYVWNECDCIGLLFEVVNWYSGKNINRASHIPSDLGYEAAIKWLHDSFSDPLLPFLKMIVDEAGVPCYNRDDWSLAIMSGDKPIITSDNKHYPIHIVPGVAIRPKGHPAYIMGRKGLITANIYPSSIRDFISFNVEK